MRKAVGRGRAVGLTRTTNEEEAEAEGGPRGPFRVACCLSSSLLSPGRSVGLRRTPPPEGREGCHPPTTTLTHIHIHIHVPDATMAETQKRKQLGSTHVIDVTKTTSGEFRHSIYVFLSKIRRISVPWLHIRKWDSFSSILHLEGEVLVEEAGKFGCIAFKFIHLYECYIS